LDVQLQLPPGWVAVDRAGSMVVGNVAVWLRPDGRGLHLQADVDRLAAEARAAAAALAAATAAMDSASAAEEAARQALARARESEAVAASARRRAEEVDRAAAAAAESAGRESAWLAAQVARLEAEAARLRAALPQEPDATRTAKPVDGQQRPSDQERRVADLQRRRRELAEEVDAARAVRRDTERRRAQADAAATLAERQLETASRAAADLAEREGRLAVEREDIVRLLAGAAHDVATAEAKLADIVAAAKTERERFRVAETSTAGARERLRIAQERARLDEREEVEARLAREGLREQLLVELGGLGRVALRHLGVTPAADTPEPVEPAQAAKSAVTDAGADDGAAALEGDD